MRIEIWLLLFLFSPLSADELMVGKVSLSGFYEVGVAHYENEEYLDALKYLFAYREANIDHLRKDPVSLGKIDHAIAYCDKKIRGRLARFGRSEKAIGADSTKSAVALHVGMGVDSEGVGEEVSSAVSDNLVYRVETLERELRNLKQDREAFENIAAEEK